MTEFLTISENFPKFFRRPKELSRSIFRKIPKIAEDFRGPEDVLIVHQGI